MRACTRCALRTGADSECTQVVPGVGSQGANVAFFGEGPGRDEDEKGEPFVGRSGQLLRAQLRSAKIGLEDVYISNTVRCRPPGNRDPLPEEAETCWHWTHRTLVLIQPRIIVALGRPALATLARKLGFSKKIGQLSITKLAGKPIFVEERNFFCYPIFHPAYALRNPRVRAEFQAHIRYLALAIPGWLARP